MHQKQATESSPCDANLPANVHQLLRAQAQSGGPEEGDTLHIGISQNADGDGDGLAHHSLGGPSSATGPWQDRIAGDIAGA